MMSAEFKLKARVESGTLILTTEGYINHEGGEQILAAFEEHFANGIKQVIVNLADSKVVNSIGISYLIEILEKLNGVKGKLIFTDMDAAIEKTLTIMGLFTFAGRADTVAAGLKEFA
jgi:anti-anti-sigma factor